MYMTIDQPTVHVAIEAPLKPYPWGHFLFSVGLFVLATCSASTFFVFGQRELLGKEAGWKTILYLPFLMSLGIGVGLNNAKAVLEAIWGAIRRKPSEFVRTPKYGVTGQTKNKWRCERVLTFKRLWLPFLEIAFGVYMTVCIGIALIWSFGFSSIPFLLIFAGGYFYVGFSSLHVLVKMDQEAAEVLAEAAGPAST
jgi:hypothetical protein